MRLFTFSFGSSFAVSASSWCSFLFFFCFAFFGFKCFFCIFLSFVASNFASNFPCQNVFKRNNERAREKKCKTDRPQKRRILFMPFWILWEFVVIIHFGDKVTCLLIQIHSLIIVPKYFTSDTSLPILVRFPRFFPFHAIFFFLLLLLVYFWQIPIHFVVFFSSMTKWKFHSYNQLTYYYYEVTAPTNLFPKQI